MLKFLEEVGIIIKTQLQDNKKINLYLLTEKCLALTHVLIKLAIWSDKNLRDIHPIIVNGESMALLRNDKTAFASMFEKKIQGKTGYNSTSTHAGVKCLVGRENAKLKVKFFA